MIKRIIFDIDGTLITDVNFTSYITKSLKEYGINDLEKTKIFLYNIKEYEKQFNYYDKNIYLNFFSEKLGIKLDYKFLKIFFNQLKFAVPKNSDKIKEMLSQLNNYELVLLSNYFEESQRNRLTTMGINDYFNEYYGEKIIKPNKEAYISAKGKYNPYECLIVGDDKLLDIDIPKKLGFNTVYVNENGDIKSIDELSLILKKEYN